MTAPSRVMFLFSCLCMLSMPWLRLACKEEEEDIVAVIIMLTTSPYFLFFCRYGTANHQHSSVQGHLVYATPAPWREIAGNQLVQNPAASGGISS